MALLVNLQPVPNRVYQAVKARILANRAKWLEKQRLAKTRQATRPRPQRSRFAATSESYRRPEPSATRRESGGIAAVEYRTEISGDDQSGYGFGLRLALPGGLDSQTITADSPGKGYLPLPYPGIVDSGRSGSYGRFDYQAGTTGNPPIWVVYANDGIASNYQSWPGAPYSEPPLTGTTTETSYGVESQEVDKSQAFFLPVSADTGVFVYVHNRANIHNLIRRYQVCQTQAVNERKHPSIVVDPQTQTFVEHTFNWGEVGYKGVWDQTRSYNMQFTVEKTEVFDAYQIMVFLVTKDKIKPLVAPSGLEQLIRQVCPPVTEGISASGRSTKAAIVYTQYWAVEETGWGFPEVTTLDYTVFHQSVRGFNHELYVSKCRYGNIQEADTALARHFGMGYLNKPSHYGPFSTPAIFKYLTGPMQISSQYTSMRRDYFAQAPSFYLAPCARQGSSQGDNTEFDRTSTAPISTGHQLAASAFRRYPDGDVRDGKGPFGGYAIGEGLYAWDWGKPSYCRGELLKLGFTSQDLQG